MEADLHAIVSNATHRLLPTRLHARLSDSFRTTPYGRSLPVVPIPDTLRLKVYPLCKRSPPGSQAWKPPRECRL